MYVPESMKTIKPYQPSAADIFIIFHVRYSRMKTARRYRKEQEENLTLKY